jgi:exodeoxyribonuclease-5
LDEPLNADQQRAVVEIEQSIKLRRTHTLTGEAGAGKTFLVQKLALKLRKRRMRLILSAPTHAAVSVLRKKLRAAGIDDVPCRTIQSVLSLKPKPYGDKLVFERSRNAEPIDADVIVCDESPMVSESLMQHIELLTPNAAVLFAGDECQLNPVGEKRSRTFDVPHQSRLTTNERQRADNPLLDAALTLRASQGGPADWSWVSARQKKPYGIYIPSPDNIDPALKRAFTSHDFKMDSDNYVYLAWTNQRVADINTKVRYWIYGDIVTPLAPGERALTREPVVIDDDVVINNNEEVVVERIEANETEVTVPKLDGISAWRETIEVWRVRVMTEDGAQIDLDMVGNVTAYNRVLARIKAEAQIDRKRWKHYHAIKDRFAVLQSIYARTIHCGQGMTVKNCFLDIPEMRRWSRADLLESQRGAYVGLTRPTHAAILCGAAA